MSEKAPLVDKDAVRGEVLRRIRRAEGQIRALVRQLDAGADCATIISQIKAARTALDAAGKLALACQLASCLNNGTAQQRAALEQLLRF